MNFTSKASLKLLDCALINIKEKQIYLLIIHNIDIMESLQPQAKYIAIIISEVKSSSRQLYPLTKNYPMSLLPIGSKKLIVYQLESLLNLQSLSEVVIVTTEQQKSLKQYIGAQFLPQHPTYPFKITFATVKDLSNTFAAVKQVLSYIKISYEGFLILHADTIIGVPLKQTQSLHQLYKSDLTLLLKAKRELTDQEKKLPEGEVQAEIDNILLGENNEVLFIDMADQIDNNGVKLDPSIYHLVKKAHFKRVVDSKAYFISSRVGNLISQLSSEQIYEIKPWLIQMLVQHQTNKKLLNLSSHHKDNDWKPLKIHAHFNQQDAFIKKISSKKVYECLNFDSLIRGPKQKEILLPTHYNDKTDQAYKGNACVAEGINFGTGGKMRRCIIGAGCKIGKNVELLSSIILQNVQIKDNCKINDSVIGAGSNIGQGAIIKGTYGQSGCRVADGVKVQSDTLIRNQ